MISLRPNGSTAKPSPCFTIRDPQSAFPNTADLSYNVDMSGITRLIQRSAVFCVECLVHGYRVALSPLLIGHCKFVPSCSEYFLQAVREWGVLRGSWLGLKRLARCRPFGMGGIDPVPPRPKPDSSATG